MKLQQDLNKEGSEVERPESRPPMQLLNELKAQMQVGSVGTGPSHCVPHPQHAVRKAVPSLKRWRTAGGVSPIPAQMWAGVLPLGSRLVCACARRLCSAIGLCLTAQRVLVSRPRCNIVQRTGWCVRAWPLHSQDKSSALLCGNVTEKLDTTVGVASMQSACHSCHKTARPRLALDRQWWGRVVPLACVLTRRAGRAGPGFLRSTGMLDGDQPRMCT
jgi:hypothetical protein